MGNQGNKGENSEDPTLHAILFDESGICKFYRDGDGQQYEKYRVAHSGSDDFENRYQYRVSSPSPYLVNAIYAKATENQFGCTSKHNYQVVTERIPERLTTINNLSGMEALYVMDRALRGFQQIFRSNGITLVKDSMIGINQYGQVKVWLNGNFALNACDPQPVSYKMLDQADKEPIMVDNIMELINSRTRRENLWRHFMEHKYGRGKLNFAEAVELVERFLQSNGIMLPTKFRNYQESPFQSSNRTSSLKTNEHVLFSQRQEQSTESLNRSPMIKDSRIMEKTKHEHSSSSLNKPVLSQHSFAHHTNSTMGNYRHAPEKYTHHPKPSNLSSIRNKITNAPLMNHAPMNTPVMPHINPTPPNFHSQHPVKASFVYSGRDSPQPTIYGQRAEHHTPLRVNQFTYSQSKPQHTTPQRPVSHGGLINVPLGFGAPQNVSTNSQTQPPSQETNKEAIQPVHLQDKVPPENKADLENSKTQRVQEPPKESKTQLLQTNKNQTDEIIQRQLPSQSQASLSPAEKKQEEKIQQKVEEITTNELGPLIEQTETQNKTFRIVHDNSGNNQKNDQKVEKQSSKEDQIESYRFIPSTEKISSQKLQNIFAKQTKQEKQQKEKQSSKIGQQLAKKQIASKKQSQEESIRKSRRVKNHNSLDNEIDISSKHNISTEKLMNQVNDLKKEEKSSLMNSKSSINQSSGVREQVRGKIPLSSQIQNPQQKSLDQSQSMTDSKKIKEQLKRNERKVRESEKRDLKRESKSKEKLMLQKKVFGAQNRMSSSKSSLSNSRDLKSMISYKDLRNLLKSTKKYEDF